MTSVYTTNGILKKKKKEPTGSVLNNSSRGSSKNTSTVKTFLYILRNSNTKKTFIKIPTRHYNNSNSIDCSFQANCSKYIHNWTVFTYFKKKFLRH